MLRKEDVSQKVFLNRRTHSKESGTRERLNDSRPKKGVSGSS